jgi:hypothetical protein
MRVLRYPSQIQRLVNTIRYESSEKPRGQNISEEERNSWTGWLKEETTT